MHGFCVSDLCLARFSLFIHLFADGINGVVSRIPIKRNTYSSFVETVDDLTTRSTAVSMVLDPDLALL